MEKKAKVIVLILSFNNKHLLDDAVSSYIKNDYTNFEVVVIDNCSTDGTKEYVEKKWPEIKLLHSEINLKYSGGFNYGLHYAFNEKKADYALVTNNDVKVDSKIISSLVEVAESKKMIGFVTGKVFYYDHPEILQTVGKLGDKKFWRGGHIGAKEKDIGKYEEIREIDWCDDIFWLVKRELFIKTGGYDTEFEFQAEDFDWQVRAKKFGYKLYYTPKAKLWHKDSISLGKDSPMKSYYNFRNPLIVHMKHRTWKQYKAYLIKKTKILLIISIKNLLKIRFLYVYKSWEGFFSAIKWGIRNKKFRLRFLFYK